MSTVISQSELETKRRELLTELEQVKELSQRLMGAILLIDELLAIQPNQPDSTPALSA